MAQKKKKKKKKQQSKKLNYNVEEASIGWKPMIGGRYVFFNSLLTETINLGNGKEIPNIQLRNLGMHAQDELSAFSRTGDLEEISYNDTFISYLDKYLEMLKNLISAERAAEAAFFDSIQQHLGKEFDINNYFDDGIFNYINFMKDINLILQNKRALFYNIKRANATFKQVEQAQDKYITKVITNLYGNNSTKDKNTIGNEYTAREELNIARTKKRVFEQLKSAYAHNMGTYKNIIEKNMTKGFAPSIAKLAADYINKTIKSIVNDNDFLNALEKSASKDISGEELVALIITKTAEQLNSFMDNKIDQLFTQDIKGEFAKNLDGLISEARGSLFSSVKNAINARNTATVQLLQHALKGTAGLAALLEKDQESINELRELLGYNRNSDSEDLKKLNELYKSLIEQNKNEEADLRSLRGELTKEVNRLLKSKYSNIAWGSYKDSEKETVNKLIKDQFLDKIHFTTPMKSVRDYLAGTTISIPTMAEILSMPGAMKKVTDALTSTVLGTTVQLKADVVVSVTTNGYPEVKVIMDRVDLPFDALLPTDAQNEFMKMYRDETSNTTNIDAARDKYIETYQRKKATYDALMTAAETPEEKSTIDEFFKKTIEGSISVKEYNVYMPNVGYKAGSLGGSGRVVQAVPQILGMLELGGITIPDANLIVQILLNSFSESVIGTKFIDDISALLIGGAAMMMFDDGFANAKAFLEEMEREIEGVQAISTKKVHLLYLNGIYVPQSYALELIVSKLEPIINDIKNNQQIKSSTKNGSISINNPVNTGVLKSIQGIYKIRSRRWNAMASFASENVTIAYLFMGGMLDLTTELYNAFKVK